MKQTGGSVASDAVTSLVTPDTYSSMNSAFTNNYTNGGGKQCGGGMNKCPTCGGSYKKKSNKSKASKSKPLPKKGGSANASASLGDFMSSLAKSTASAMKSNFVNSGSVFQSQPSPALNSVLPRNVGLQTNAKSHFTNVAKPTVSPVVANVMKSPFTHQEHAHHGGKKTSKKVAPKKKVPLPKKKV